MWRIYPQQESYITFYQKYFPNYIFINSSIGAKNFIIKITQISNILKIITSACKIGFKLKLSLKTY